VYVILLIICVHDSSDYEVCVELGHSSLRTSAYIKDRERAIDTSGLIVIGHAEGIPIPGFRYKCNFSVPICT
jgi:hypothetical protein